MLNQVVLVGRLVKEPELRDTDSGKKVTTITLAIPRSFKNLNGDYDTDFVECILWDNIAMNTSSYCKKGDILGIRGRIQVRETTIDDKKRYIREVIAEKVSFLSSSNNSGKKADVC